MELALVLGVALAFYTATLAPTLVWGDSAWLALDAVRGAVPFGTAGDHPLFVLVGQAFTHLPGDPARNMNLEAAVFAALTVMLVFRCARQLGSSRLAAGIGAAALCVSHAFWLHAVVAEVYTANAFFLVAVLTLLLDWKRDGRWAYLAAAAAVFVLGLTNHLVLATMAPSALVFVLVTKGRSLLTPRFLLALVAGLAVAAVVLIEAPSPIMEGFRKVWIGPPSIFEYFRLSVDVRLTLREAGYYLLFLVYQFPSVSLPLVFVGIAAIVREDRKAAILLLLTVIINGGVFIHHTGWQSPATSKFVFYISDYVVFAILCGVGAETALRWLTRRLQPARAARWGVVMLAAVAVWPPLLYAAVPAAASRYGVDIVHARAVPYRDNQRYFLNPNKHGENGARRFGQEALAVVPPAAVIFADYTPFAVLRYLQEVEHIRPDVLLGRAHNVGETVPVQWVFEDSHRRPTYLATWTPDYYDLSGLTGGYVLVPAGPIFEVRPRDVP